MLHKRAAEGKADEQQASAMLKILNQLAWFSQS
jgi:hypothetical protein